MTLTKCAAFFSVFALIYGLGHNETFSFLSGWFAGAAAVTTYIIWEEESNGDDDDIQQK